MSRQAKDQKIAAFGSSYTDLETGMTTIHIKSPSLSLKAGPRAYARIRANGHLGERWLTL